MIPSNIRRKLLGHGVALVLMPIIPREHHLLELLSSRPHGRGGWIQRRIQVRFIEKGLDGDQHCSHVVQGRPLVFQDIEANVSMGVNVRVETCCLKCDDWGDIRIPRRELEGEFELQSLVDCLLRSFDRRHPLEEGVSFREGRDTLHTRQHQLHQLLLEPLCSLVVGLVLWDGWGDSRGRSDMGHCNTY